MCLKHNMFFPLFIFNLVCSRFHWLLWKCELCVQWTAFALLSVNYLIYSPCLTSCISSNFFYLFTSAFSFTAKLISSKKPASHSTNNLWIRAGMENMFTYKTTQTYPYVTYKNSFSTLKTKILGLYPEHVIQRVQNILSYIAMLRIFNMHWQKNFNHVVDIVCQLTIYFI